MSDKIKVGIKVRPLISREKNGEVYWVLSNDGLQQQDPATLKPKGDIYTFGEYLLYITAYILSYYFQFVLRDDELPSKSLMN